MSDVSVLSVHCKFTVHSSLESLHSVLCKVGRSYRLSVLLASAARPPRTAVGGSRVAQLLCALEGRFGARRPAAQANRAAAAGKRRVAWCDVKEVLS